LRYQRDLIPKDCQSILASTRLSQEDQQKVHELSNHIRLQTFIEVDYSYILMINGAPRSQHVPRSVVTFVSAKLVDSLRQVCQSNRIYCALAYFCGEHHRKQDEFSSARDMIITLLLQLLDQYRDFEAELLETCRATIFSKDIKGLCDLFERFVQALPEQTVLFCVLDGIGFFETPQARMVDTMAIIERLLQLSRERAPESPIVKLLFTTPARCLHFSRLFEPYEVFTLRSNSYSRGVVRDRGWRRTAVGARVSALSDSEC